MPDKTIWTIGHSTRTFAEFLKILHSFDIQLVADIRSYPGSRKYPHFNKDSLAKTLPKNGIEYQHIKALGGRRKAQEHSKNMAWRNESFRGYADHMDSDEFQSGINELKNIANEKRVAYMCSEAVWWRCHRSLVSDLLKSEGWKVIHIMGEEKFHEHPYTQPAKIIDGKLYYSVE